MKSLRAEFALGGAGMGHTWSKTDWIVVVPFCLIVAAITVYCVLFYYRRFCVASFDKLLTIDDTHACPSASEEEPSTSRSRSSEYSADRLSPSDVSQIVWNRPPVWDAHQSQSERGYHDFDGRNRRPPPPFFIDIPNEQFLHGASKHAVLSS